MEKKRPKSNNEAFISDLHTNKIWRMVKTIMKSTPTSFLQSTTHFYQVVWLKNENVENPIKKPATHYHDKENSRFFHKDNMEVWQVIREQKILVNVPQNDGKIPTYLERQALHST